jgi:hypothetical protein
MSELVLQPICFGAVTYHGSDAARCGLCVFQESCAEQVQDMIGLLGEKIDIAGIMERHRKILAKPASKRSLSSDVSRPKPKKKPAVLPDPTPKVSNAQTVRDELRGVIEELVRFKHPDELRAELRARRNPFPKDSMKPLWVMGELLRGNHASNQNITAFLGKVGVSDAKIVAIRTALIGLKLARKTEAGIELQGEE